MTSANENLPGKPEAVIGVGSGAVVRRRWTFSIQDWNDHETYVTENGAETDYSDAKEFIGTGSEAQCEADRRADLWETKQNALAARVTFHSHGVVTMPDDLSQATASVGKAQESK